MELEGVGVGTLGSDTVERRGRVEDRQTDRRESHSLIYREYSTKSPYHTNATLFLMKNVHKAKHRVVLKCSDMQEYSRIFLHISVHECSLDDASFHLPTSQAPLPSKSDDRAKGLILNHQAGDYHNERETKKGRDCRDCPINYRVERKKGC